MDGLGTAFLLIFAIVMFGVIIYTIVSHSTTEQTLEEKSKMEIKDAEEFMREYDEMNNTKPIQRVVQKKKRELNDEQKEALEKIDSQVFTYKIRHYNTGRKTAGWIIFSVGVIVLTFFSWLFGPLIEAIGLFLIFDYNTPIDEELSKETVKNMIIAYTPMLKTKYNPSVSPKGKNIHIYEIFISKFPEKESKTLRKISKMKWK